MSTVPLICLICVMWVTVSPEHITKRNADEENDEICVRDENVFTYNICHDPSHPHNMLTETNRDCHISRRFARVMKEVTRYEKYLIDGLIRESENLIGCENTVRTLRLQSLSNRISINYGSLDTENVYTSAYLQVARVTYLLQHLSCKMTSITEECCLHFPTDIFQRMKSRLLNKWYTIQNACGDYIGQQNCEGSIEVSIESPMSCEDARDIIYLLLKHARDILQESIPVIDLTVIEQ